MSVSTSSAEASLFKESYTRGLGLMFYGVIWLVIMLAGLLLTGQLFSGGSNAIVTLLAAIYASALVGAMGGATALLIRLYQDISVKQNFPQQSTFTYLIQPVVGMVAGILMLLIITLPATLLVNFARSGQLLFAETFASSTLVAIQILLAWIAGFYQRKGLDKARAFLNKEDEEKPASEQVDQPQEAPLLPAPIDVDDPLSFKEQAHWQRQMVRWSFTWGLFIFLYGVVWMVVLVGSYLAAADWGQAAAAQSIVVSLVLAAWPVAIAGGVGGVVGMYTDLYQHISYKKDFHRQFLMAYLVQPIVGLMYGAVMYFFIAAGYLAIDSVINSDNPATVVDSGTVIMAQMVLGLVAGFRQQSITRLIQKLLRDIVTFVKLVGKLLQPKNLFKKANRDKVLAEIGEHTSLFKAAEASEESTSNASSEEGGRFSWLGPD